MSKQEIASGDALAITRIQSNKGVKANKLGEYTQYRHLLQPSNPIAARSSRAGGTFYMLGPSKVAGPFSGVVIKLLPE
jgi:hypothetical protein